MRQLGVLAVLGLVTACATTPATPSATPMVTGRSGLEKVTIVSLGLE